MKVLLVAYDNGSYAHYFPIALAYIAAALKKEGYQVEIYNQDQHHYPDEHLTEYLNRNPFDVIGVGIVGGYYQYRKILALSEAINASKNRPFYILGGHGPSPEPEFFLKKTRADAVVIGEGEDTIIDLMNALAGSRPLAQVLGIAFWEGSQVVVNERRPLIQDIDGLPFPAYNLFPVNYYRLRRRIGSAPTDFSMSILSGRGCPFKCTFCYRMDEGFRPRSNESIIEEIQWLHRHYGITYIRFSDELLMSSKERTISLCEAFIKVELPVTWQCNGRLNYATPEVLKAMKAAGCDLINYGIEAMDDQVLKNMRKSLTTEQVVRGVQATTEVGIYPRLNIIFGNIGDTPDTLQKGVDFLLQYDPGAERRSIRPVTPYPGSELYDYAIEHRLLEGIEDFYENKHLNSDLLCVNFTQMTDDDVYKCLVDANSKLLKHYHEIQLKKGLEQIQKLYLDRDANFRGFRRV